MAKGQVTTPGKKVSPDSSMSVAPKPDKQGIPGINFTPAKPSNPFVSGGGGGGGGGSSSSSSSVSVGEAEQVMSVATPVKQTAPKESTQVQQQSSNPLTNLRFSARDKASAIERGNIIFVSQDEANRFKGTQSESFTVVPKSGNLYDAIDEGSLVAGLSAGVSRETSNFFPANIISIKEERQAAVSKANIETIVPDVLAFKKDPLLFEGQPGFSKIETDSGTQISLGKEFFESRMVKDSPLPQISKGQRAGSRLKSFEIGVAKGAIGAVEFVPEAFLNMGSFSSSKASDFGAFKSGTDVDFGFLPVVGPAITKIKQSPVGLYEGLGIGATVVGGTALGGGGLIKTFKAEGGAGVARSLSPLQPRGVYGKEFIAGRFEALQDQTSYTIGLETIKTPKASEYLLSTGKKVPGAEQITTGKALVFPLENNQVSFNMVKGTTNTKIVNPFEGGKVYPFENTFGVEAKSSPVALNKRNIGDFYLPDDFQGFAGTGKIVDRGTGKIRGFNFGGAGREKDIFTAKSGPIRFSGREGSELRVTELIDLNPKVSGFGKIINKKELDILGTETNFIGKSGGLKQKPIQKNINQGLSGLGSQVQKQSSFLQSTNLKASYQQDLPTIVGGRGARGSFSGLNLYEKSEITAFSLQPSKAQSLSMEGLGQKPNFRFLSLQIDNSAQSSKTRQDNKFVFGSAFKQNNAQFQPEISLQSSAFKLNQRERLKLKNPNATEQSPFGFNFNFGFKAPPRFPITFFPPLGFDDAPKGRRKGKRKLTRTPTLFAGVYNITSTKPFRFEESGLGTRPILISKRRKKKK